MVALKISSRLLRLTLIILTQTALDFLIFPGYTQNDAILTNGLTIALFFLNELIIPNCGLHAKDKKKKKKEEEETHILYHIIFSMCVFFVFL